MRKGEELKAPRYASAAALCDDHVTIYNIIPNSKRNLSYSIVNIIGGKYPKAPKRPNKGRKYNSNTLKNRNNRIKRLASLGRYPSK